MPMTADQGRGSGILRGVDGCRGGWLALSAALEGPVLEAELHADATSLLAGAWDLTAVDMPIGLPEAEPRACDREARRQLGARRSSVFAAPPRAALEARDHPHASALCRRALGVGMSLQSFHLLPKIRDLDRQLRTDPRLVPRVLEVHPELGFCLWNGGVPLSHAKKSPEGRQQRLALVETLFPGAWGQVRRRFPRRLARCRNHRSENFRTGRSTAMARRIRRSSCRTCRGIGVAPCQATLSMGST